MHHYTSQTGWAMAIIFDMSTSSYFVQVVIFCPNCHIVSKLSDFLQIVILYPNSQIVSKLSDRVSRNQNLSSMTHVCLYLRSMPIDGGLREREGGLSSNYHSSNIVQMFNTESSYSHHHCVQSVENGEQIYPSIRGPIPPNIEHLVSRSKTYM